MQTKISGTGLTKITDHWSKSIVDLAIDSARQAISESNTSPDMIIEYSDGNKIQPVTFSFEVEIIGGELGLSNETIDFGWYTVAEIEAMDTLEHHLTRIHDSVKNLPEAAFR